MKRRTLILMPLLLGPEEDWNAWIDEWNALARAGQEYANAMNAGDVDRAVRALPRVKKAGRRLFCGKEIA